jgi:hypothetical protein
MIGPSALLIGLVCVVGAADKEKRATDKRYGIQADLKAYPQATPKEALASVLKAIDAKRIDYLLAQLADPDWVDKRVKGNGGSFTEVVEETTAQLIGDPGPAKLLRRFLKDGTWNVGDTRASVRLKDVEERVYLHKVDGRWFLENRKK